MDSIHYHHAVLRSLPLILGVVLSASAAPAQQQSPVAVLQIGPFDGGLSSEVRGINNAGMVAGANIGFPNEAFGWFQGEHTYLGSLNGGDTSPWAVNELADVVGYSDGLDGRPRAFLWSMGKMIDLRPFGDYRAEAWHLNDQRQVVGFSRIKVGTEWAFVWESGHAERLETLGGSNSLAYFINSDGSSIVGSADLPDGTFHAVLWLDPEKVIDLGTLQGDRYSQAFSINDAGEAVGESAEYLSETHAALWRNGQIIDLNDRNVIRFSTAYGINNRGEIVGLGYTGGGGLGKAVYWTPDLRMYNLNTLIPPNSGWNLTGAWKINDAGQIACQARRDGAYIGALVTPINATMNMAAPSPGRSGESNVLRVTGATPGAAVRFLYSRHGGGARIPGCDLQQNALQLDSPTVIGTAIADANGVATITRTVPPVARGQTILFQAVVQNECAISQLVEHRFE
jgi:probable HAF family extracellular repeat protein